MENKAKDNPLPNIKSNFFIDINRILKAIGKTHPLLIRKTEYCKHSDGCLNNIISGSLQSFLLSYSIKSIINLISLLISIKKVKKNPLLLIYAIFNKDSVRFACFPGIYCFILKVSTCLSRYLFNSDTGLANFFSGALAGFFSLMIQSKSSRNLWSLFLFTRALDITYRHLINHKKIKKIPFDYVLLFGLTNMVTGYAFAWEPDLNPNGINKFYLQFSKMHKNDIIFRNAWIEKKKLELIS